MNIAAAIKAHTGVRYVVLGPFVYRLRRITSAELHAAGFDELVGAGAGAEALHLIEQEEADARVRDPVKRAEYRAHNEAADAARARRDLEAKLSTPEGRADWFRRVDAYVVASIDGAGPLRDGVVVEDVARIGAYQVLPPDARIADYTVGIDAFRFVLRPEDEDPQGSPPSVCVRCLTEIQRQALGLVAMSCADVVGEVLPFRARAGAADAAAQAG